MFFLFILLSTLLIVFFYLKLQFKREQKRFEQRIDTLQKTIFELNQKAIAQSYKIQLIDEFEKTLLRHKPKLGNMIFDLNYNLFASLSKNNML